MTAVPAALGWVRRVLRRSWRPAAPSIPRPREESLPDGLMVDLVEMTRHAVADGLSLEQVYDDLRIVLGIPPAEGLPTQLLRECALAWSRAHQEALHGSTGEERVPYSTPEGVEERLWSSLASSPPLAVPTVAVLVGLLPSMEEQRLVGAALLGEDGRLQLLAHVFRSIFRQAGEAVVLLRDETPARGRDRVLVLAHREDVEERIALARAQLDAGVWSATTVVVGIHDLADSPDGMLAALRAVMHSPE